MEFNTLLLHGRMVGKYANNATVPPITQTSAYSYPSAEQHEKVFRHQAPGYAYSRVANPTVSAFEQRIAELEGGISAVAVSSGMAAITLALLNVLSAGDEVIAGSGLYGGTLDLFRDLERFGIKTHFVHFVCKDEIEPLMNEHTKVVFGELISNPGLDVMDVRETAGCVHAHGIPLFVDSTTATPYLCRPLTLGADVVIHSSSKYINGGGNSISGMIVDGGKFRWDSEKFPALAPFLKYRNMAYTIRLQTDIRENIGSCLAPFNAFMNVVGMETLGLRMDRICENAKELAEYLTTLPDIHPDYPSLWEDHCKDLVESELGGRGGGILTFRAGSKERAFKIIDNLQCVVRASNIGDVRTLVIHPASTLYINSSKENTEAAGVYEDTVRVSVGIEDIKDLKEDFRQAVEKADQEQ